MNTVIDILIMLPLWSVNTNSSRRTGTGRLLGMAAPLQLSTAILDLLVGGQLLLTTAEEPVRQYKCLQLWKKFLV